MADGEDAGDAAEVAAVDFEASFEEGLESTLGFAFDAGIGEDLWAETGRAGRAGREAVAVLEASFGALLGEEIGLEDGVEDGVEAEAAAVFVAEGAFDAEATRFRGVKGAFGFGLGLSAVPSLDKRAFFLSSFVCIFWFIAIVSSSDSCL